MVSNSYDIFLNLVRKGIGHDACSLKEAPDWTQLKALADRQGLGAVVLDGLDALQGLSCSNGSIMQEAIPLQMKLEWIGEVLQNYEQRYMAYERAIKTLAGWYSLHGFQMMVLKGYACSLDWPCPKHRPCGDIDIWLFGKQKESDRNLSNDGIKIDTSEHHHTVFYWQDFMVENHYDFVNVHAHRSSKELEVVFKELGQDDSHIVEVNGEKIYLPSPDLHALFLVKHMVSHFAAAEITLRQVLDWAFFVEKHTTEINWEWLARMLEKYHMLDFYNCINAICVGNLGFDVKIFPNVQFEPTMKERVLMDILSPEYGAAEPRGLLKRMVYKLRRWQGNAWKQEMCYGESRWTMFWSGVWNHLLKPSSI